MRKKLGNSQIPVQTSVYAKDRYLSSTLGDSARGWAPKTENAIFRLVSVTEKRSRAPSLNAASEIFYNEHVKFRTH